MLVDVVSVYLALGFPLNTLYHRCADSKYKSYIIMLKTTNTKKEFFQVECQP